MVVGQREQLSVVVRPDGIAYEEIQWSSISSNVAMVAEDGIVEALHEGESVVTASIGSEKGICHIKVMPISAVINSLSLDQTDLKLSIGETCTLSVTIEPIGASAFDVEWTSSDASRASVQGGVVKALAPGITIITAAVGSNKADCQVRVFDDNAYEFVDLGLSVLWGAYNIGAEQESDYGGYYAWGELNTKMWYNWDSYQLSSWKNEIFNMDYYNSIDNLTELEPGDDIARQLWGGNWRMPTAAEYNELIKKCNYTWMELNNVKGIMMTSKVNGNSIFFPAGGFIEDSDEYERGSMMWCWASTKSSGDDRNADGLECWNGSIYVSHYLPRYLGFPVRAVKDY